MADADLLRRAAANLREHANEEFLPPGPWTAEADDHESGFRVLTPEDEVCGGTYRSHAEYIALMHPPVAIALAGWLDDTAATINLTRDNYALIGGDADRVIARRHSAAFAVARAVLRDAGPAA